MKSTILVLSALLCDLAVSRGSATAAAAQAAPTTPPIFGADTAAVVLDVVVRDKRQRAVRDLQASDFEVLEDGVRQQIDAFSIVSRPPSPASGRGLPLAPPTTRAEGPTTQSRPPEPPSGPTSPTLIAFAFDRLSAAGRDMARRAALTYLDQGRQEDDLVAIFAVDLALHPLLSFTNDAEKIRAALVRAVSQGNTSHASASDRAEARQSTATADAIEDRIGSLRQGVRFEGSSAAASAGQIGEMVVQQLILNSRVATLRAFERLERDQQGYATSKSLLAIVAGLSGAPGRKTLVLFSEGLSTTSGAREQFHSVIAAANRANVAIYAMDVAGLRVESNLAELRDELSRANMRRPAEGERLDSITKTLERNEELLQLNPEAGLGELADQTGGFLIRDTNDAGQAFQRIGEDMRFHYVLSYTPRNDDYDGKFRRIAVKLKRAGLEIHSRDGYRAVKPGVAPPLPLAFETAALAQLDRSPTPSAFGIRATGLSLPDPKSPGLVPILVRVPGSAATYGPVEMDPTMMRADFSIAARIKDSSQQVVGHVSRHFVLTTPTSRREDPKGDIFFYGETNLPSGRYTLEAVGYDAVGQQASVTRTTFEVPKATETGLRLSSLVLVKGVQALSREDGESPHPLAYGESALYPNMGEPLRKSEVESLTFYFTAIPPREGPPPSEAVVELLRDGQSLRGLSTPLGAPNASGRIQTAAALPLSTLAAGAYELRVTVAGGTQSAMSSVPFTVED